MELSYDYNVPMATVSWISASRSTPTFRPWFHAATKQGSYESTTVILCASLSADTQTFLWSSYVIGQTIIFLPYDFYLLLSSSFFPRLISAVGEWMSTILPHMVWPLCEFRMHV